MNIIRLLFIVAISGFIGYMTNVLAIRCLFRPYEKIKLGPLTFQGLIPKRRDEIADQVGQIVAREFVNNEDIVGQLIKKDDEIYFTSYVSDKISIAVTDKISFLPELIRNQIIRKIKDNIEKESSKIFDDFKAVAENQIREKVDLKSIIVEKIDELELREVESLVLQVTSKELKAIELLGLVMGLAIGLIQGLISFYIL